MAGDNDDDARLAELLTTVRRVAVVGLSDNPARPSFGVAQVLKRNGYTVFGVNPALSSRSVGGIPVFPRLDQVPSPVDMVDIFRNSAAAGEAVDEALALGSLPRVIWMQLGVINLAAAARAEARGVAVVMNRCPAIEIPRLGLAR